MKEYKLIDNILGLFNYRDKNLIVPNGDDCAVFDTGNKREYYLITKDDIVENTHYLFNFSKPEEIATKLIRMNVSDIYSMGDAKPLYCVISGGINPEKVNDKCLFRFLKAVKKELDLWNIKNIGGNLARSETVFFSMTLIGSIKKNKIIRRKGARSGDLLCSLGTMGDSRAAVEIFLNKKRSKLNSVEKKLINLFYKPVIFYREAKIISDYATSMLDNSDGLYKSSEILSRVNKLQVVIDIDNYENIISKELYKWCKNNSKNPIEYAIAGGEDYNLIFSISENDYIKLKKKIPYIYRVGYFKRGSGIKVKSYEDKIKTFEHF
jgi:thiamine-monophosphate kinase